MICCVTRVGLDGVNYGALGILAPQARIDAIGAGVVDYDYRDNVGILVYNHSKVSTK